MEGLAPENLCLIDYETRATVAGVKGDLTKTGVDVYEKHAFPIMLTWKFGGGKKVGIAALDEGFDSYLDWELDVPDEVKRHHELVERGEAFYGAWNMGFDRAMWNSPASKAGGFPELKIEHTIDVMAQATVSGLPAKLDAAAKACGFGGKMEGGKGLINLFSVADGATPQSHPEHWTSFKDYGILDTDLLEQIYMATRALPLCEWEDYWVSEHINQRGFALDVNFAERAAAVADANRSRVNAAINKLTTGVVPAVTNIQKMTTWVYDRLETAEARDIMVKKWNLDEEDDLQPAKLSMDKPRIEALMAYFNSKPDRTDIEQTVLEVLEHRYFGGSTSPAKFGKMLLMQVEGVLRNQYTFNGAPQTGRFSSRGVQIHNLMRRSLGGDEEAIIELINLGVF